MMSVARSTAPIGTKIRPTLQYGERTTIHRRVRRCMVRYRLPPKDLKQNTRRPQGGNKLGPDTLQGGDRKIWRAAPIHRLLGLYIYCGFSTGGTHIASNGHRDRDCDKH